LPRVLIVDDDDLMRAGLAAVLSTDATIEVVGEAANGREAVDLVSLDSPDVVLMDVRMPELDGIAATAALARTAPSTKILILTTFDEDELVFAALRSGASGFLLKRTRPEDLVAAVHTVAGGEALLSPSVTRRVIDRMANEERLDAAPRSPDRLRAELLDELTPREREVLELIAKGLSNSEIAGALVVEESTVKTHVKRVLMKLGLRDRIQAVIFAYETGVAGG
jgi:DNA-binding NarL/FixJ family response regulator